MTRQVIALSIVLLVSVIINVGLIFDKFMSPETVKPVAGTEKPLDEPKLSARQQENMLDFLQKMVTDLKNVKTAAQRENAPNTIRAIDAIIKQGSSQIAVFSSEISEKP